MKVGKIIKIGESFGVVIPRQYLRDMGWVIGDYVTQEIKAGGLELRNVNKHLTTFRHDRTEYGDGRRGRTK